MTLDPNGYGTDPNQPDPSAAPSEYDAIDAILHGMQPNHLSDLDTLLGVEHPTPDMTTEQMPEQSFRDRLLGSFAGSENAAQPPAQSFLQGLLQGGIRGVGSAGTRAQAMRAKLESDIAGRQRIRDARNAQASHDYQQNSVAGRRALALAALSARAQQERKPTPADIKAEAQARAEGTAAGTPDKPDPITLDSGDLTPAGLDAAARAYAMSGQLPPMGMGKNPLRAKIINRAAELSGPNFNPAANKVDLASEARNLSSLTQQHSSTRQQEQTVYANADVMLGLLGKVPDTGVPFLNAILRPGQEKLFGSTEVSNFNTALATVQPEFARILTQGPSGSGPLSDSARHELQSVISGSFTKKQLRGAIATLKKDAANRTKAQSDEIEATKRRIASIGSNSPAPAPRPSLDQIFGGP